MDKKIQLTDHSLENSNSNDKFAAATTFCCNCHSKAVQFECIDCTCSLNGRTFCGECSVIHPTKHEAIGHVMVALQRNSRHRNKRCEHGREKRDCIPCGGSRVCEHQRLKRSCRQCGGEFLISRYILLNIHVSNISFCIGSRICEHGNYKNVCKECGGSGICSHNKIKYSCSICKISNRKVTRKAVVAVENNQILEPKRLKISKLQEIENLPLPPFFDNGFNSNMLSQEMGHLMQTMMPPLLSFNQNFYMNPNAILPVFGNYPAINLSQFLNMNMANCSYPPFPSDPNSSQSVLPFMFPQPHSINR